MELRNKLVEVFPTRPLKVMKLKQEGKLQQLKLMFAAMLFFVLAMFTALTYYPGLIDTYRISRNPVVVNYHVEGKCRVKSMIDNCSVKITTKTGKVIKRDYILIGGKKANYRVVTVASANNPSLVTINLAIENMRTQFVITTIIILFFTSLIWMGLVSILRIYKMLKVIDEINGQKLTPVVVPIKLKSYGKIVAALYNVKNLQGVNVKYVANFDKNSNDGPIIIGDVIKNKCNALAVIGENNPVPIILNQNFTRCDFTDYEIQALKEALS
ncbi:hypothetical protein GQ597_04790 [Gilliamella sp. Pra-s65]|uniref:hypothetical protein n=1 Tax=unclassified Gilliamella TaxID=2685620 RepID=UPI001326B3AE|nr:MULTISPECIES: hypothetical protein [unclassified Gilliamella]MWN32851.1 hypothetical protein [Gilliamella sp. Pra-s60]MWN90024.1 hypothetical protein [Gilliamella sp. Pra-s65]MWP30244.1 hypothetical protein [Gilliamella sp. Pra-s54]MWP72850.1 hypothetical protein [Gilliamella sp. Pra-s52]